MINIDDTIIGDISLQQVVPGIVVSNLNSKLGNPSSEADISALRKLLLQPFTTHHETYEFDHEIDLSYNVLFNIAKDIHQDADFKEQSRNIHQHLVSVSTHPNIKEGDLFIARFEQIGLGNKYVDGLGIYKFEQKERFIETNNVEGRIEADYRRGLGTRKPEKGCLILFDREPFTILVIDSNSKETDYWRQDFIQYRSKQDNVNDTNNFLKMAKTYITDQMPSEFEVERADQIELLNKSIDFFNKNESFNKMEFEQSVLEDDEAIKSFQSFGQSYKQTNDVEIHDEFDIAPQSVKKQSRIFKSVLKLDKNFHVYIHGDRRKIERGEDSQGKFYKIYFENET
jgi:hypothetical protein